MTNYNLTQAEYKNMKSALTRASNKARKSGDPADYKKLIRVCESTLARFDDLSSWPDNHFNWTRAMEDAQMWLRHNDTSRPGSWFG